MVFTIKILAWDGSDVIRSSAVAHSTLCCRSYYRFTVIDRATAAACLLQKLLSIWLFKMQQMDNMTTTNASQNRHSKYAGKNGPLLKEPLQVEVNMSATDRWWGWSKYQICKNCSDVRYLLFEGASWFIRHSLWIFIDPENALIA